MIKTKLSTGKTSKRGFTLVELLIVIAIIGILAGVFFIGVTGFRNSALDARRIADLKNIQNSLELYYSKCRLYPNAGSNSTNCPTANTTDETAQGSGFESMLTTAGLGVTAVPKDPVGTTPYTYKVAIGGQSYVLVAVLSGDRDVLKDPATLTSAMGAFYDICNPLVPYAYCIGTR